MRALDARLRQLEAHREQAIEAAVRRLERNPRVDAYMQAATDTELRLLSQGAASAMQRFGLACGYDVC